MIEADFSDVETIDLVDDFKSYDKGHWSDRTNMGRSPSWSPIYYDSPAVKCGPNVGDDVYARGYEYRHWDDPDLISPPAACRGNNLASFYFWRGWASGRMAEAKVNP